MKKSKYYFWLGLIISLIFLYISFRNFQVRTILHLLRSMDPGLLLSGVAAFVLSYFFRAPRWQMMLRSSRHLSFKTAVAGVFLGQFGNNVLPWRLGDLWRAVIAKKMDGFSAISAGMSLLMEKIFDGLSVFILSIVAILSFSLKKDVKNSILFFGLAVVVFLALLWTFYLITHRSDRGKRGDSLLRKVIEGLSSIKEVRIFLRILIFSVFIWVVEACSFLLFFRAFNIHLRLLEVFIIVFIVNFAMVIPAAPANLGTFEYAIVLSASVFSIDKSTALSAGLVIHFLRFVSIALVGLVILATFKMSLRAEVQEVEMEAEKMEL